MIGLDFCRDRLRQLFRKTPMPEPADRSGVATTETDDISAEVEMAPEDPGAGSRDRFYTSGDGLRDQSFGGQ